MTDFIQVVGYVDSGSYTVINKKNSKVKHRFFDIYNKPDDIRGYITRVREFSEGTEEELKKEISGIFYKEIATFLKRVENKHPKYVFSDPELNIDFSVSIASQKSTKWCLENLTIPQLLEMGMTCIKGWQSSTFSPLTTL